MALFEWVGEVRTCDLQSGANARERKRDEITCILARLFLLYASLLASGLHVRTCVCTDTTPQVRICCLHVDE